MQKRFLFSMILLITWSGTRHAQANLVRNPGFEGAPTKQGIPGEGWWVYESRGQPDIKVDRTLAHNGKASVRLQAKGESRFVLVSPRFEVSPDDELQIAAWARGDKPESKRNRGYIGLAFRDASGRVFARAYFQLPDLKSGWSLISGAAKAPANAVSAEAHLGYTNATGPVWIDDVSVEITSPVSLALVEGAHTWPGPQEITVRVINRETKPFRGSVRAVIGRKTSGTNVVLESAGERLVKVPVTLSGVGAHDFEISLLDATGGALRTLGGKFRTAAPLVLFPACPCYHIVGEGRGETRIDARIAVNPALRRGLKLAVELSDASGSSLHSSAVDASNGEIVGCKLRVPVSEPAVFMVTARLLDAARRELAKAQTDIHAIVREESRVTVGPDGFLRIGDRKHFPIGMYSCGRYEEMGKAGFSGTHNYGITTGEADEAINPNEPHLKELLDRSWTNGMRMMVELPRKAIEKAQWAQIRRRVETFRHHPGLLCWGSEERVARGEAPLANIAALYRLVRELDPDHPLVLGDTREVIGKLQQDRRNFFPDDCMDVGIWWWYPIPLPAPDGNGLEGREKNAGLLQPPSWLTTTQSKKPLWIAIQSYQHPRKDARFPTPEEYRCLAYLSIMNGVKGLWFYTGSGQRDWQGKPAGLLNKPEEGHWDYVQQLVRELRELEPAIMGIPVLARFEISPPDAPVEFAVRELNGKHYVFAANKSDREQAVRFTGRGLTGRRAEVLYEHRQIVIKGDSLQDSFGPFGVHVYRLPATLPE